MSELPTIPGYVPERLLGEGSYGRVYLARQEGGLQRQVAIKLYTREGNADFQQELSALRKVEALRQDGAPGLVQSLATGEHEGQGFLVFEYLGAGSLADAIEADGPLPIERAVEVAVELGKGLDALHAAGIWHRDVKPQNVLLGVDGVVKLADFGLARGLSGTLSAAGSPAFAAPEVIAGRPADGPRADVYSLGATLIYAVTGSTILPGRPDAFVLEQAGVPRPVQKVLLQATAADPADRLGTVRELLDVLERAHEESARLLAQDNPETPRTESIEPDLESEPTSERKSPVYTAPATATSDDYFATSAPSRTSRAAIWSLICAILVFPSVLGLVGVGWIGSRAKHQWASEVRMEEADIQQEIWSLEDALWREKGKKAPDEARVSDLQGDLDAAKSREEAFRRRAKATKPADFTAIGILGLPLALCLEVGAIVLGLLALSAIGKSAELAGRGIAIGGLVVAGLNALCVLCLVPLVLYGAMSVSDVPNEAVVMESTPAPQTVENR